MFIGYFFVDVIQCLESYCRNVVFKLSSDFWVILVKKRVFCVLFLEVKIEIGWVGVVIQFNIFLVVFVSRNNKNVVFILLLFFKFCVRVFNRLKWNYI